MNRLLAVSFAFILCMGCRTVSPGSRSSDFTKYDPQAVQEGANFYMRITEDMDMAASPEAGDPRIPDYARYSYGQFGVRIIPHQPVKNDSWLLAGTVYKVTAIQIVEKSKVNPNKSIGGISSIVRPLLQKLDGKAPNFDMYLQIDFPKSKLDYYPEGKEILAQFLKVLSSDLWYSDYRLADEADVKNADKKAGDITVHNEKKLKKIVGQIVRMKSDTFWEGEGDYTSSGPNFDIGLELNNPSTEKLLVKGGSKYIVTKVEKSDKPWSASTKAVLTLKNMNGKPANFKVVYGWRSNHEAGEAGLLKAVNEAGRAEFLEFIPLNLKP